MLALSVAGRHPVYGRLDLMSILALLAIGAGQRARRVPARARLRLSRELFPAAACRRGDEAPRPFSARSSPSASRPAAPRRSPTRSRRRPTSPSRPRSRTSPAWSARRTAPGSRRRPSSPRATASTSRSSTTPPASAPSRSTTADGGGGMGLGAPPGTSSQIVDLEPGPLTVSCTDPAVEVEGRRSRFEIVDEDGIWVSTTLGCPDQFSQVVDYVGRREGRDERPARGRAARRSRATGSRRTTSSSAPATPTPRRRVSASSATARTSRSSTSSTTARASWLVGMVTGCSSLED